MRARLAWLGCESVSKSGGFDQEFQSNVFGVKCHLSSAGLAGGGEQLSSTSLVALSSMTRMAACDASGMQLQVALQETEPMVSVQPP